MTLELDVPDRNQFVSFIFSSILVLPTELTKLRVVENLQTAPPFIAHSVLPTFILATSSLLRLQSAHLTRY